MVAKVPRSVTAPRQLRVTLFLAILGAIAAFLFLANLIDPPLDGAWLPRTNENQRQLANNLSRTSVTLISTVFGCLFLAIPLTASLYTPQFIRMFVSSTTNRVVLGFFVFSAVHAIWVSRATWDPNGPQLQLGFALVLVTSALALLLPYLFSVFRFLDPRTIIARVAVTVVAAMLPVKEANVARRQERLMIRIRQLGNIILRTLDRADRDMALVAVDALDRATEHYLVLKERHFQAWFDVDATHFPGFSADAIELVRRDRTWVEFELLRQLGRAYGAALAQVPDVISAISRAQRHFVETAAAQRDAGAVDLGLRSFNNFLREAVKRGDIHAVYDLLYQFRELAIALWAVYPERVVRIGRHLDYYGRRASAAGMPFAQDLVAYDFGRVVASVPPEGLWFDELIAVFLEVHAESATGPTLSVGMAKARWITAAQLAADGNETAAQRIAESVVAHDGAILAAARRELSGPVDEFFWEVTDRQQNLDWVPLSVRPHLQRIMETD